MQYVECANTLSGFVQATFTVGQAKGLIETLTHTLAGHHNRLEHAVLMGNTEFAQQCAEAAACTRAQRSQINRALSEAGVEGF